MKLIVGLGNPGPEYAGHRHSIGFLAVDAIARENGFATWRKRFQGLAADGTLGGAKTLLLKPETYMNESGRSVGEAMRFLKLEAQDVIVLHDELDIAAGSIRMKTGGGNAGHNGLKSISAHIGNDYVRVRLGIGHPGRKELVSGYVLHDFSKSERIWLDPLLDAVAIAALHLSAGEGERFVSEVARRILPEGAAKTQAAKAPPKLPKSALQAEQAAAPPATRHPAGDRIAKQASALAENLARWKTKIGK